ncbi:stage II sporulation protein M [Ferruginibacter lapsinanis]|uniref:stage II sporulation protein M n=1 Tax=Ferruginibacter lapsinanis TaxID=563172 RepID=UPI001E4683C0|nr:stage II sporulation protein M [Ferruginibacter lapsinanis]UEG49322.1 stage II sporulation protein M [Ferruginibacter lapsinanis]
MFIKKNVDKWNEYQHSESTDPDETAERFVTLVDDLSYAKTFYPKSKVTRWINSIAASIYLNIYQNKKEKYNRFFIFWKYELPLLFKRYHRILLFTFLVFLLFVAIGVFGSIKEPGFIRGVLGDAYVNMTEENIANGDPFGVYKSDNPFTMFVHIAMNNIFVAFLMAIGGILCGAGTLFSMWQNGLMLGCFQYMFFAKGLGIQSVMVIWVHGTLEILSFVVASTAGFIIANGILFPGTYSRSISFRRGVKDALKVMIVLVPIFILAAFFESYVTHLMSNTYDKHNNIGLPVWGSGLILFLSLVFIVWYFVILPIQLHKKGYQVSTGGFLKTPAAI